MASDIHVRSSSVKLEERLEGTPAGAEIRFSKANLSRAATALGVRIALFAIRALVVRC